MVGYSGRSIMCGRATSLAGRGRGEALGPASDSDGGRRLATVGARRVVIFFVPPIYPPFPWSVGIRGRGRQNVRDDLEALDWLCGWLRWRPGYSLGGEGAFASFDLLIRESPEEVLCRISQLIPLSLHSPADYLIGHGLLLYVPAMEVDVPGGLCCRVAAEPIG